MVWQAVVGEAGPELLYNTSKGAKVVPLNNSEKQNISTNQMPETISINLLDMKIVTKLRDKINEKNKSEYIIKTCTMY